MGFSSKEALEKSIKAVEDNLRALKLNRKYPDFMTVASREAVEEDIKRFEEKLVMYKRDLETLTTSYGRCDDPHHVRCECTYPNK